MTKVYVSVAGAEITVSVDGLLTSGMVGVPVEIEYDSSWDGLIKTAFFRNGEFTRKRENIGTYTTVPWEVVRTTGILEIGLSGAKEDGSIVMPTVWCRVDSVKAGANSEIHAAPNPDYSAPESSGATIDDTEISTAKVWSSLKTYNTINEQAEKFNSVFEETISSINILNPENSEPGYFDANGNLSSDNYIRTKEPIAIVEGTKYVYLTTNLEELPASSTIYLSFLNDAGEEVKKLSSSFAYILNSESGYVKSPMLTSSVTNLKVYIRGVTTGGYSFENLCISTEEPLGGFESYLKKKIKDSYIPDEINNLPNELDSIKEKNEDQDEKISALENQSGNKALKLYGKTIVNFGDSIFGLRRPPNDISTKLAELTGATVYNCGFGGCTMAYHGSSTEPTKYDAFAMYQLANEIVKDNDDATKWASQDAAIAYRPSTPEDPDPVPSYFAEALQHLKDLDFANVDIITIAYGTNDFTRGTDLEKEGDLDNTKSFAGALRYSIETLLAKYPHLRIFICSQTFRFFLTGGELSGTSDDYTNADGVKLTDFVEKTESVAKEYHLPYINNYDIGLNVHNRSYYFSATDGTHPLTSGLHIIAENMANKLF